MLAVWWAWIYTAWITNWLDPEHARGAADAVRADAGRARAVGLDPEGVRGPRAAVRAAYVFMQVGRSCSCCGCWRITTPATTATSSASPSGWRRPRRSGLPVRWSRRRPGLRCGRVALAIEYAAPRGGFWLPRLGRSTTTRLGGRGRPHGRALRAVHHHRARRIDPDHRGDLRRARPGPPSMWARSWWPSSAASPCGWSISTSAPSAAAGRSRPPTIPAAWRAPATPTSTSRSSPASSSPPSATNWCCIIPADPLDAKTAIVLLGGPALYLVGNMLFKRLSAPNLPLSHWSGLALLALLIPAVLGHAAHAVGRDHGGADRRGGLGSDLAAALAAARQS